MKKMRELLVRNFIGLYLCMWTAGIGWWMAGDSFRPNDAFNPIDVRIDASVDARQSSFGATNAKRGDANDSVHALNGRMVDLNRSSGVSLARIAMQFRAETELCPVDDSFAQISTQMRCIWCIANQMRDHIQNRFLQSIADLFGVLSSTPTSGNHFLCGYIKRFGQTSRSHVLTQYDWMFQFQQCDVIVFRRYFVVGMTNTFDYLHIDGLSVVFVRRYNGVAKSYQLCVSTMETQWIVDIYWLVIHFCDRWQTNWMWMNLRLSGEHTMSCCQHELLAY